MLLKCQGKISQKLVDTVFGEVLTSLSMTDAQLDKIDQENRKLNDSLLVAAREHYSDAWAFTWVPQKKHFRVHDVRDTIIAYLWIGDDGQTWTTPEESAYHKRVN